jgi:hypothetical protein
MLCQPHCLADSDCGPQRHCDTASGTCRCAFDQFCQGVLGPSARCDRSSGRCTCTPNCAGRQCGPDGCGGTCGSCASNQDCNSAGACFLAFCGEGGTVRCSNGVYCPPNSTCAADGSSCYCNSGHQAVTCAGATCNGNCAYPDWHCM